jgi:hypothetical protein
MCYAGEAATSYYYKLCQDDKSVLGKVSFRPRDIWECNKDLERTYTVRIFAEFERQLRDFWTNYIGRGTSPRMRDLVDSVAGRYYLEGRVVNNVHSVREYRNGLVHGGGGVPLTLAEARGHLLRYLGDLPQKWLKSG